MTRGKDEPRHIVVTGASRGLGLEFTRQWLAAGNHVYALARNPSSSRALDELREVHTGALRIQQCDVADDGSVASAGRAVEAAWDSIDILLNNAGTYGQRDDDLAGLDLAELRRVFEVDAIGPLRVTRSFLPLLKKGAKPRLIHISSLMGSIEDNGSGGSYAYRMSKAALNMASRNMAHELKGSKILSVALHPGWVRTDMGGPDGRLTPQEAVASMITAIDGFGPKQSGGFFNLDGKIAPW